MCYHGDILRAARHRSTGFLYNIYRFVVVVGFTLRVNMLLLYVAVADDIIMLAESAGFWELGATHSCLGRASWSKREALTVRLPGVLVVPVRM